jgi:hypothetical protein
VITPSANAVVAKKGSLAYDASKAALNHLLVSQRLSKTTGHILPVDGGLQDGFLR